VSICKGHVAAANKLALSSGLSQRITHHHLNATKVDTLTDAPFSGAYSCEVLAEIPDDGLRACFAALYNVLPSGAEFSYADIVSTEGTPTSRGDSKRRPMRGLFSRLLSLIAPLAVKMMAGDDWRPVSKFNSLLSQAGFEVLSVEYIGDRVFVPTWEYAQQRMQKQPDLGTNSSRFIVWVSRLLTKAQLGGLASLWEGGQINYVLVKARRV
jgi:hypothetical protein